MINECQSIRITNWIQERKRKIPEIPGKNMKEAYRKREIAAVGQEALMEAIVVGLKHEWIECSERKMGGLLFAANRRKLTMRWMWGREFMEEGNLRKDEETSGVMGAAAARGWPGNVTAQ